MIDKLVKVRKGNGSRNQLSYVKGILTSNQVRKKIDNCFFFVKKIKHFLRIERFLIKI